MFEVIKTISFWHQKTIQRLSVGESHTQQKLVELIGVENVKYFIKHKYLTPKLALQETRCRFEKSGYKKEDNSSFRKTSIYRESEITNAGLDIDSLLEQEAITWLK